MHIKELKKANSLLARLEELDKEIIGIEKYGQLIMDQHMQINLKLSHSNPQSCTVQLDEDGSLELDGLRRMFEFRINPLTGMFSSGGHGSDKKESGSTACELNISEVIALQVLGVMVAHKEAERMAIINQLRTMGFEVAV